MQDEFRIGLLPTGSGRLRSFACEPELDKRRLLADPNRLPTRSGCRLPDCVPQRGEPVQTAARRTRLAPGAIVDPASSVPSVSQPVLSGAERLGVYRGRVAGGRPLLPRP